MVPFLHRLWRVCARARTALRTYAYTACIATLLALAHSPAFALTNYAVTSTGDDGSPGTLRWAMDQANNDADDSAIAFTVSGTISVTNGTLPIQTEANSLSIDGTGFAVTIEGSALAFGSGIESQASPLALDNISITKFPDYGVRLINTNGSRIGSDIPCSAGNNVLIYDNLQSGILVSGLSASNNQISCADIYNNGDDGITIINGAFNNTVTSNIGIRQNSTNGIKISGGAHDNMVADNAAISLNVQAGILVADGASDNLIAGQNDIQLNFLDGIQIDGPASVGNAITAPSAGPGATIAYNGRDGISFSNSTNANTVYGPHVVRNNTTNGIRIGVDTYNLRIGGAEIRDNSKAGIAIYSAYNLQIGDANYPNTIRQNATNGIEIFTVAPQQASQIRIAGNTIESNTNYGIFLGGSSANIQNVFIGSPSASNTIQGHNAPFNAGFQLAGILVVDSNNVAIDNTTLTGNDIGLQANTASNLSIANSNISGNTYEGIKLNDSATTVGPLNTLSNNGRAGVYNTGGSIQVDSSTFSGHSWPGLLLHNLAGVSSISGNTFTGNGNTRAYGPTFLPGLDNRARANFETAFNPNMVHYFGALLISASAASIDVSGNRFANQALGINIADASNVTVQDNGLTPGSDGFYNHSFAAIRVQGPASTDPLIDNNRFDGNNQGINIHGGTPVINQNTFVNQSNWAIYSELLSSWVGNSFYDDIYNSNGVCYTCVPRPDLNAGNDVAARPTITNNSFTLGSGDGIHSRESTPLNFNPLINGTAGNTFSGTGMYFEQSWYGLVGGALPRTLASEPVASCRVNGEDLAVDADGICPVVPPALATYFQNPGGDVAAIIPQLREWYTTWQVIPQVQRSSSGLNDFGPASPHTPSVLFSNQDQAADYSWDGNTGNDTETLHNISSSLGKQENSSGRFQVAWIPLETTPSIIFLQLNAEKLTSEPIQTTLIDNPNLILLYAESEANSLNPSVRESFTVSVTTTGGDSETYLVREGLSATEPTFASQFFYNSPANPLVLEEGETPTAGDNVLTVAVNDEIWATFDANSDIYADPYGKLRVIPEGSGIRFRRCEVVDAIGQTCTQLAPLESGKAVEKIPLNSPVVIEVEDPQLNDNDALAEQYSNTLLVRTDFDPDDPDLETIVLEEENSNSAVFDGQMWLEWSEDPAQYDQTMQGLPGRKVRATYTSPFLGTELSAEVEIIVPPTPSNLFLTDPDGLGIDSLYPDQLILLRVQDKNRNGLPRKSETLKPGSVKNPADVQDALAQAHQAIYSTTADGTLLDFETYVLQESSIDSENFRSNIVTSRHHGINNEMYVPNRVLYAPVGSRVHLYYFDGDSFDASDPASIDENEVVLEVVPHDDGHALFNMDSNSVPIFQTLLRHKQEPRFFEYHATGNTGLQGDVKVWVIDTVNGRYDLAAANIPRETTAPGIYYAEAEQYYPDTGDILRPFLLEAKPGYAFTARWTAEGTEKHYATGMFCTRTRSYIRIGATNSAGNFQPVSLLKEDASFVIQVGDADRNTDTERIDTISVQVETDKDLEIVAAIETTADSGVFQARLQVNSSEPGQDAKTNNVLDARIGTIVTISYEDRSPPSNHGEICDTADLSSRQTVVGSSDRLSFIYFYDADNKPVRRLQWPGTYKVVLAYPNGNVTPDGRDQAAIELAISGNIPGPGDYVPLQLLESSTNPGFFEGQLVLGAEGSGSYRFAAAEAAQTSISFGQDDIQLGERMYASFSNPDNPTDNVRRALPIELLQLEIDWKLSEKQAAVGDLVLNTMTIHNPNHVPVEDAVLSLHLLQDLRLHPDSIRVPAQIEFEPGPERDRSIRLRRIEGLETLTLRWVDTVPPTQKVGTRTGFAQAFKQRKAVSNEERVELLLQRDPLFENGTLVGRVFHDVSNNHWMENYEEGMAGVVLYTSQGHKITTDKHGRFHLGALPRGSIAIKIDPGSLPAGAVVHPGVHSVDIWPGQMSKADFAVSLSHETISGDWVELPYMQSRMYGAKTGFLLDGTLTGRMQLGGQSLPERWPGLRAVQVRSGTLVLDELQLKPLTFEYNIPDPEEVTRATFVFRDPAGKELLGLSFRPAEQEGTIEFKDTRALAVYQEKELAYRLEVVYRDGVRSATASQRFNILEELPTQDLATASHFEVGSRSLEPLTIKNLRGAAELLRNFPAASVVIEGHTDHTGGRDMNLVLSQWRADKAKEYLVIVEEIEPDRIRARGYGPDFPIASNNTEAGRSKNRRVVITVEGLPHQDAQVFKAQVQVGERVIQLRNNRERVRTLVRPGSTTVFRDTQGRTLQVPFTVPDISVEASSLQLVQEPDYAAIVTVSAPYGATISGTINAVHQVTGVAHYRIPTKNRKKIHLKIQATDSALFEYLARVRLSPLDTKSERDKYAALDPASILELEVPPQDISLPRRGYSALARVATGTTLVAPGYQVIAVTDNVYRLESGPLQDQLHTLNVVATTANGIQLKSNRTWPVRKTDLVWVGNLEGRAEWYRNSHGSAADPDGAGYSIEGEGGVLVTGNIKPDLDMTMWLGVPRTDVRDLGDQLTLLSPTGNEPGVNQLRERSNYLTYGDDATVETVIAPLGPGYMYLKYRHSEFGWGAFRSPALRFSLLDGSDLHAGAWTWISDAPGTQQEINADTRLFAAGTTWTTEFGGFVTPQLQARNVDRFFSVGTSLYFLRQKAIVPGSEQVEIGVVDSRTGLMHSRHILERGEEYRIDYDAGQVVMLDALPLLLGDDSLIMDSTAGRDAPVLLVRYDYYVSLNDSQWEHREMISQKLSDYAAVQAYFDESRTQSTVTQRGGGRVEGGYPDAVYGSVEWGRVFQGEQLDTWSEDGGLTWHEETTRIKAGEDADAWHARASYTGDYLQYHSDMVLYDADYLRSASTFGSQRFSLQNEVQFYADAVSRWNTESWGALSSTFRHTLLSANSGKPYQQIEESEIAYRYDAWDSRIGGENRHGPQEALTFLAGELGYRFSLVRLYGKHQHTVREKKNPSGIEDWITSIGTQWFWNDRFMTDLRASLGELSWGGQLAFSYQQPQGTRISLISTYLQSRSGGERSYGIGTSGTQPVGDKTELTASQRYNHGDTSSGWLSSVGARTSILEPVTLHARFEKGIMQSAFSDARIDRTVAGFGGGFVWKDFKLTSSNEYRLDKRAQGFNRTPVQQPASQWNTWNTLQYRWNEDLYSLANLSYSRTVSANGDPLALDTEIAVGAGYRPVRSNFVDVLGMVRWLQNQAPVSQVGDVSKASALVASVDTYFQLPIRLFARYKTAWKLAGIVYVGPPVRLTTTLQVLGAGWNFWGPLYAYGEYRFLAQLENGARYHGPTAEFGLHPGEWVYVGIGYNFSRIDDVLYATDPLDREGVYARLKITF